MNFINEFNRGRVVLRSIMCLALIPLILSCNDNSEINRIDKELKIATTKIATLTEIKDSLETEVVQLEKKIDYWLSSEFGSFVLKGKPQNFSDREYVESLLDKNNDIIPISGSFGSKMLFSNFEFFSSKWIIADYEDGHNMGRAILEIVNHNNILKFEILSLMQPL